MEIIHKHQIFTFFNSRGKSAYKCLVKCIVCELRVPCQFNSYWQISNYEAHLKRAHSKDIDISVDIVNAADTSNENSTQSLRIQASTPNDTDAVYTESLKDNTNETGDKSTEKLTKDRRNSTENTDIINNIPTNNRISISQTAQEKINNILEFDHLNLK